MVARRRSMTMMSVFANCVMVRGSTGMVLHPNTSRPGCAQNNELLSLFSVHFLSSFSVAFGLKDHDRDTKKRTHPSIYLPCACRFQHQNTHTHAVSLIRVSRRVEWDFSFFTLSVSLPLSFLLSLLSSDFHLRNQIEHFSLPAKRPRSAVDQKSLG